MAQKTKTQAHANYKIIAANRRARYDYALEQETECGLVLYGSEVKALRTGQSNIADAYATVEAQELWLLNSYIAPYEHTRLDNHAPRRKRKLLVRKRELHALHTAIQRQGMTIVPLVLYFNHKGRVKIKIGLGKGKKLTDKRQTEARRDWNRQQQRLLRHNQ